MTDGGPATEPETRASSSGITTRTGRIWMRADGIVQIEGSASAEHTRADAERGMAAVWEIAGHRRLPLFVDLRAMRGIDREARKYYAGPEPAAILRAVALLVDSPLTRLIASFVVGLVGAPVVPIRVFTVEAEAIAWLRDFRS